MPDISYIAQTTMDLYYQQLKSNEDFFEFEHFKFICEAAYAMLLQLEYEKKYNESRNDTGIANPSFNPEWFIPEDVEVKRGVLADYEAEISTCPFSFNFDNQSRSVLDVYSLTGNCRQFVRTTMQGAWKQNSMPNSSVVNWATIGQKLLFWNAKCGLKKVRVYYMPSLKSLSEGCELSDSLSFNVMTYSLDLMKRAKAGEIINVTNDQNPNKVIESEINKFFRRA